MAAGGQSKPRLARVEPWSRATKVGQSWPWSALVSSGVYSIVYHSTGEQSVSVQVYSNHSTDVQSELCSRVTKVNQGQPWSALVRYITHPISWIWLQINQVLLRRLFKFFIAAMLLLLFFFAYFFRTASELEVEGDIFGDKMKINNDEL